MTAKAAGGGAENEGGDVFARIRDHLKHKGVDSLLEFIVDLAERDDALRRRLDITALARQDTWEDSPDGYPRERPYEWWNWRDSFVPDAPPDPEWVAVSDAGEAAFRKGEGQEA